MNTEFIGINGIQIRVEERSTPGLGKEPDKHLAFFADGREVAYNDIKYKFRPRDLMEVDAEIEKLDRQNKINAQTKLL